MNKTKGILLSIGILTSLFALISWNNTKSDYATQQATIKYEYCHLVEEQSYTGDVEYSVYYGGKKTNEALSGDRVSNLDHLGNQGWELVNTISLEGGIRPTNCIFSD